MFETQEPGLFSVRNVFAIGIILYLGLWYKSYRRLSHIPGPRGWGWSILPWMGLHLSPGLLDSYHELIEKYGPLVRVGPNTLLTSDAEIARKVGAVRSSYVRSDFYMCMRLNPGEDHIFSLTDEDQHQDLRKKMGAGYSGKDNLCLEKDVDDCILDLVQLIKNKYLSIGSTIKPMDLAEKIIFLTSDIISQIAFNAKLYNVRDDLDHHGYIKNNEELFPNLVWTATVPSLIGFLTRAGVLQLLTKLMESQAVGLVTVRKLVYQQISKRFQQSETGEEKQQVDMLNSFLRHGLTEEEAQRESMLNLTAGTDTTATPMRAVMLGILTNPRIYNAVRAEIEMAEKEHRLPSNNNEVVSEKVARELPYIQACIKEGLRWLPPVIGEFSKVTPPEGDTICGYRIPGGVKIGFSQKSLHRNPSLYGPDADSFRPERWLLDHHDSETGHYGHSDGHGHSHGRGHGHNQGHEVSADKLKAMERNNDLVFGHGRFQCLGKPVAMMELSKIFVELFRRFDFEVVNPTRPWVLKSWGVAFISDFWVVVRERK